MVLITYLCDAEGELQMSDEHQEFRWCSIDEAENLLEYEKQKVTLMKYKKMKSELI